MHDWSRNPGFEDHPPVSLRDRGLWWVLAVAFALQLVTLVQTHGYQLADAVEYMERANMAVRGDDFDPRTSRPFTLSALLMPLFWATHALELETYTGAVALARVLQMLVGLATVVVVARIGSRIGGRGLGLAAGLMLAASVPFARYTVEGLADTETMFFVALALESLLGPRTWRRGLLTGLYAGAAAAFSYKAIPVVGAMLFAVFLRERLRHGVWWRGTLLALFACLAVAAIVDTRVYGDFGSSLAGYVLVNVMSILARLLYRVGLIEAATWVGNTFLLEEGRPRVESSESAIYQVDPESYYFVNASTDLYAWPLLMLVLLGVLASFRRFRFPETLIAFVVVADVLLLGQKGHKSYRLMMPVLPLIGLLGAFGLRALRGEATASLGRRMLAYLFLGVGVLAVPGRLMELELGQHGGYWQAMEIVNADAERRARASEEEGGEPARTRVASAFHWAATLRQRTDVDLVRLPLDPLDYSVDSPELRAATERVLDSLDWFVAHMQVFSRHPELVACMNRNFEVHTILYDGETYGRLMPVFVLRRRGEEEPRRTFFRVREGLGDGELAELRAGLRHPVGLLFDAEAPEGGARQTVELLGWDVETGLGAPPDDGEALGEVSWITYHWLAHTDGAVDLEFRDRLTDFDGRATLAGLDGHRPAYGARPAARWKAGTVLSESYARVLPVDPTVYGGAHRRGELVPTTLWMGVRVPLGGGREALELLPRAADGRRLRPHRVGEEAPERAYRWAGDGAFWDRAGRVAVGGFWLPIPLDLRVPDDGRDRGW